MTSLIKETGRLAGQMRCFRKRAAFEVARALGRRQRIVCRRGWRRLASASAARTAGAVASRGTAGAVRRAGLRRRWRSRREHPTIVADDPVGLGDELAPGDADHPPAGPRRALVAAAVVLEGVPGAVGSRHRRSRRSAAARARRSRPGSIGSPSPRSMQLVDLGLGHAPPGGRATGAAPPDALGGRVCSWPRCEQTGAGRRAGAGGCGRSDPSSARQIEDLHDLAWSKARSPARGERRSAGRASVRATVVHGDVVTIVIMSAGVEGGRRGGCRCPSWRRLLRRGTSHRWRPRSAWRRPVQRGSGPVGERGLGAAGQDRGHVPPLAGEELRRDERVDAAVDTEKPARPRCACARRCPKAPVRRNWAREKTAFCGGGQRRHERIGRPGRIDGPYVPVFRPRLRCGAANVWRPPRNGPSNGAERGCRTGPTNAPV